MYAQRLGVTPRKLNALSDAAFGRSAKELIDERVVLELKRLLGYTDTPVKALATGLGFDDPTNLVKFFRHRTKQTPLEFRRAAQLLR